MTPQTIIARTDAAIAGYGKTVTFERTATDLTTGAVSIVASVTCPAAVRTSAPQDLLGEAVDIRVIVTPTGLGSFVPIPGDRLIIDGNPSNIQTIGPLYYGGMLCRVNMLCRG